MIVLARVRLKVQHLVRDPAVHLRVREDAKQGVVQLAREGVKADAARLVQVVVVALHVLHLVQEDVGLDAVVDVADIAQEGVPLLVLVVQEHVRGRADLDAIPHALAVVKQHVMELALLDAEWLILELFKFWRCLNYA